MARVLIPVGETRAEDTIKRSRFIAFGAVVTTTEQARSYIKAVRKEYRDARHHCPAYRIGHGDSAMEWSSDDGEPSGTAGKPILSILQGSGIGDIVVVVVRYFGGVKLGTGGLVKAYGGVTRALMSVMVTKEKIERVEHLLTIPYKDYEACKAVLLRFETKIIGEEFGADIIFHFSIPTDRVQEANKELIQTSCARWVLKKMPEDE